ncbi:30837_t:CDS:1, partial [Gigaspora margarita]
CNGKVLRNPGWKDCSNNRWFWYEAPDSIYCLHAYHRTNPHDNRYCSATNNACFSVRGNLMEGWDIYRCDE